jgi:hypothetical protein
MIHAELGNYHASHHSELDITEGDHYEFRCPVCHAFLNSDFNDRLAEIIMLDEDGREFRIVFSKIKGEKSTYKILGDAREIYGDDSEQYLDFINMSTLL